MRTVVLSDMIELIGGGTPKTSNLERRYTVAVCG